MFPLTLFKIYLDQSENSVHPSYISKFNAKKTDLFKNNLSYRFTLELRNYAQHNQEIISRLHVSHNPSKIQEISIYINRDDILAKRKFDSLRSLVESLPEEIDIMPILNDGFRELFNLHSERMQFGEFPVYEKHLRDLYEFADQAWDNEFIPCLINVTPRNDGTLGNSIDYSYIYAYLFISLGWGMGRAGVEQVERLHKNSGFLWEENIQYGARYHQRK